MVELVLDHLGGERVARTNELEDNDGRRKGERRNDQQRRNASTGHRRCIAAGDISVTTKKRPPKARLGIDSRFDSLKGDE
jgi:hypothetical protein